MYYKNRSNENNPYGSTSTAKGQQWEKERQEHEQKRRWEEQRRYDAQEHERIVREKEEGRRKEREREERRRKKREKENKNQERKEIIKQQPSSPRTEHSSTSSFDDNAKGLLTISAFIAGAVLGHSYFGSFEENWIEILLTGAILAGIARALYQIIKTLVIISIVLVILYFIFV